MKNFLIGLAFACVIVAGCSVVSDKFMVADIPDSLVEYTGNEPNKVGYKSISKLKAYIEEAKVKNITEQAHLLYLSKLDAEVYAEVSKAAVIRLEIAQKAADAVFGQGGIAVNALLALCGAGAARWYSTATLHTAEEVKIKVDDAVAQERKVLYTQEEVDSLLSKGKS